MAFVPTKSLSSRWTFFHFRQIYLQLVFLHFNFLNKRATPTKYHLLFFKKYSECAIKYGNTALVNK